MEEDKKSALLDQAQRNVHGHGVDPNTFPSKETEPANAELTDIQQSAKTKAKAAAKAELNVRRSKQSGVSAGEKLKLDSLQDLNKLTFRQIKALDLTRVEGRIFQEALAEAMSVKKGVKGHSYNISTVEFRITYASEVHHQPNRIVWVHSLPLRIVRDPGVVEPIGSVRTVGEGL